MRRAKLLEAISASHLATNPAHIGDLGSVWVRGHICSTLTCSLEWVEVARTRPVDTAPELTCPKCGAAGQCAGPPFPAIAEVNAIAEVLRYQRLIDGVPGGPWEYVPWDPGTIPAGTRVPAL